MPRPLNIVGTAEVSAMLGIAKSSVSRKLRLGTLPQPDVMLECGPVWRTTTILDWQARHAK
jgi:predicted DNA-binding transcriptional regulator AlpA